MISAVHERFFFIQYLRTSEISGGRIAINILDRPLLRLNEAISWRPVLCSVVHVFGVFKLLLVSRDHDASRTFRIFPHFNIVGLVVRWNVPSPALCLGSKRATFAAHQ